MLQCVAAPPSSLFTPPSRLISQQSVAPAGQQRTRVLHIELTDERDLLFLYTLTVTEDDFHELKQDQQLLVDFAEFPHKFVELLQTVCEGVESAPIRGASASVAGRGASPPPSPPSPTGSSVGFGGAAGAGRCVAGEACANCRSSALLCPRSRTPAARLQLLSCAGGRRPRRRAICPSCKRRGAGRRRAAHCGGEPVQGADALVAAVSRGHGRGSEVLPGRAPAAVHGALPQLQAAASAPSPHAHLRALACVLSQHASRSLSEQLAATRQELAATQHRAIAAERAAETAQRQLDSEMARLRSDAAKAVAETREAAVREGQAAQARLTDEMRGEQRQHEAQVWSPGPLLVPAVLSPCARRARRCESAQRRRRRARGRRRRRWRRRRRRRAIWRGDWRPASRSATAP